MKKVILTKKSVIAILSSVIMTVAVIVTVIGIVILLHHCSYSRFLPPLLLLIQMKTFIELIE